MTGADYSEGVLKSNAVMRISVFSMRNVSINLQLLKNREITTYGEETYKIKGLNLLQNQLQFHIETS